MTRRGSAFPVVTQITDRCRVSARELRERLGRYTRPVLVQVRDKDLPLEERRAIAAEIARLARPLGHRVIFNGSCDVVAELGLDGVHLPAAQADRVSEARAALGPEALVTVACHDVDDVRRAAHLGADAALLSPIFESPGKGAPLGPSMLTSARRVLEQVLERQGGSTSLVALGGITPANASLCLEAGADGVAVIRADLSSWLSR